MMSSNAPPGAGHGHFEDVRNTIRFSPSRTAWLRVGPGVGDFSRNRLGIKLMRSIGRVRVGVDIASSQLVQRTWLETLRQSRVVVVVDVGAYSPVTGNRARHLRGSTPRDDVGPINRVVANSGPPCCCRGTGEGRAVSGDALPSLGVDAPPNKGSLTSPVKGSASAIRVARLLLTLSSDVMATDNEVMNAFSTGSTSFAILNV